MFFKNMSKYGFFFLNEKLMYVALDKQNTYFNISCLSSNIFILLIYKITFNGFQISFPMFLNNLLCKKTSYCNCNRHLMFLCQKWYILLLNEKLLINFQKCYISKNIILNLLLIFTVNCKKYKLLKKYNF
jgi:hypothetical protein